MNGFYFVLFEQSNTPSIWSQYRLCAQSFWWRQSCLQWRQYHAQQIQRGLGDDSPDDCNKALEGIQPTFKQVPPRAGASPALLRPASIQAVLTFTAEWPQYSRQGLRLWLLHKLIRHKNPFYRPHKKATCVLNGINDSGKDCLQFAYRNEFLRWLVERCGWPYTRYWPSTPHLLYWWWNWFYCSRFDQKHWLLWHYSELDRHRHLIWAANKTPTTNNEITCFMFIPFKSSPAATSVAAFLG